MFTSENINNQTLLLTFALQPAAMPKKQRLKLNSEQLAIFRYLYVAYVKTYNLEHGPVNAEVLPKLRIRAERVATASLSVQEPHYFEPLTEDEWQRSGLELPTLLPGTPDPDDLAFCHAYSVIDDVKQLLKDEPPGEGLGLSYDSGWTFWA